MKMSPPEGLTWWIALVLTALAVLMQQGILNIAALAPYTFWMVVIASVLLLVATRIHNL
jgi:hypothetical protein